jgi:hypothetical protein
MVTATRSASDACARGDGAGCGEAPSPDEEALLDEEAWSWARPARLGDIFIARSTHSPAGLILCRTMVAVRGMPVGNG